MDAMEGSEEERALDYGLEVSPILSMALARSWCVRLTAETMLAKDVSERAPPRICLHKMYTCVAVIAGRTVTLDEEPNPHLSRTSRWACIPSVEAKAGHMR